MIVLMGHLHLDPSDVKEFVADTQAVSVSTRAEKGCLFYSVTLEDASAGRMLLVQRWQDQESLKAHLETPATVTFLTKWADRFKSELLQYDVSNERT
jgi:quinol monooxygenase YgiN